MCCLAEFCVLSFPWRICSICWSYSPYEKEKIVHLPLFYCKCLCRNALGRWNMTLLIPLNSTGYAGWQERTINKSGCCTESRRVEYISRFCHFWYNHEWKATNGVGVLQYLQPFCIPMTTVAITKCFVWQSYADYIMKFRKLMWLITYRLIEPGKRKSENGMVKGFRD